MYHRAHRAALANMVISGSVYPEAENKDIAANAHELLQKFSEIGADKVTIFELAFLLPFTPVIFNDALNHCQQNLWVKFPISTCRELFSITQQRKTHSVEEWRNFLVEQKKWEGPADANPGLLRVATAQVKLLRGGKRKLAELRR